MSLETMISLFGVAIQVLAFVFFFGGLNNRVSTLEEDMKCRKETEQKMFDKLSQLLAAVSRLEGLDEGSHRKNDQ